VHDVGARLEDVIDFLAEAGEVGGENAGGNPELCGHGELPIVDAPILPGARFGGFRKCDDGYKGEAVRLRRRGMQPELQHQFSGTATYRRAAIADS
jgi:hypothetical protein